MIMLYFPVSSISQKTLKVWPFVPISNLIGGEMNFPPVEDISLLNAVICNGFSLIS